MDDALQKLLSGGYDTPDDAAAPDEPKAPEDGDPDSESGPTK